jgi:hypothetical protein
VFAAITITCEQNFGYALQNNILRLRSFLSWTEHYTWIKKDKLCHLDPNPSYVVLRLLEALVPVLSSFSRTTRTDSIETFLVVLLVLVEAATGISTTATLH